MNISRKPSSAQLELPRWTICGIVSDLRTSLTKSQYDLVSAKTAEEFVAALTEIHNKVTEASVGFNALIETTRDWGVGRDS